MPVSTLSELIKFLTENPMLVAGTLLLLTIIIYLSKEHGHIRHKTKTERSSLWLGWGLLLLTLALFSIFTTALNVVAETAKLLPEGAPTGYVTLYQGNIECKDALQNPYEYNLTGEQQKGCQQVNYGYYGFLGMLAIGALFIVTGFVKKRGKAEQEAIVSEAAAGMETQKLIDKKYCIECGSELPRTAKHCSECGSQQPMK